MKIIVEGPECAGKSTLIAQLHAMTGYPVKHRTKPRSEEEKRLMNESYRLDAANGLDELWDRCWYSEMVYGKVMRDQSYISVEQMLELEELLLNNGGAMIIHCTDAVMHLWSRLQDRGDEYITDLGDLGRLKREYEALFNKQKHLIPVVRYELSKILY